jgi:hypothetical protein
MTLGLLAVLSGLAGLAYATPPDPIWLVGVYDGEDDGEDDAVIPAVCSAHALVVECGSSAVAGPLPDTETVWASPAIRGLSATLPDAPSRAPPLL